LLLPLSVEAVTAMPERKRGSQFLDSSMPRSEDDLPQDGCIEVGSAYSILLDDAREAPVVYVKTYGEVDVASLEKRIKELYPGVRIEGLTSIALQANTGKRLKSPKRNLLK
jgi:hypothetical protein